MIHPIKSQIGQILVSDIYTDLIAGKAFKIHINKNQYEIVISNNYCTDKLTLNNKLMDIFKDLKLQNINNPSSIFGFSFDYISFVDEVIDQVSDIVIEMIPSIFQSYKKDGWVVSEELL